MVYILFFLVAKDSDKMKELSTVAEGSGHSWIYYFGLTFGLVTVVGCGGCILALFCVARTS